MKFFQLAEIKSEAAARELPFIKLCNFHWEGKTPYRPDVFAKMYIYENTLTAQLKCYESNPKAVYNTRDGKIWCDSCLEFFVSPVKNREEYINIETNANGFFLSEFGFMKPDRKYVKELTQLTPDVKAFRSRDENGDFWEVKISLTKEFIASLYKTEPEKITFENVKANFYKCGDECATPHYIAMFPVTTLPPGFHNPDCFGEFRLIK